MGSKMNEFKNSIAIGATLLSLGGCANDRADLSEQNLDDSSVEDLVTDSRTAMMQTCQEKNPQHSKLYAAAAEGLSMPKVTVDLKTCGINYTQDAKHWCSDTNGDGEWEKYEPVDHNVPPSLLNKPIMIDFWAREKENQPKKWQKAQDTCNTDVQRITESNQ